MSSVTELIAQSCERSCSLWEARAGGLLASLEPPRCRKVCISLGAVTGVEVGYSTILVGKRIIWSEPNNLVVIADSLIEVSLGNIGVSPTYVGRG